MARRNLRRAIRFARVRPVYSTAPLQLNERDQIRVEPGPREVAYYERCRFPARSMSDDSSSDTLCFEQTEDVFLNSYGGVFRADVLGSGFLFVGLVCVDRLDLGECDCYDMRLPEGRLAVISRSRQDRVDCVREEKSSVGRHCETGMREGGRT